MVQRCFFREFSTQTTTSPTTTDKSCNNSNQLTIINKNNVTSLCDIMKNRMSLAQKNNNNNQSNNTSPASEESTKTSFPIRNNMVILQDVTGATAELLIPDQFAMEW